MQLPQVEPLISSLANQVSEHLAKNNLSNPLLIGIHTGGLWVAQALQQKLGGDLPLGSLDISFYRDDYSKIGLNPSVKPSNLPFATQNQNLVLIDDVLMSGRTIRAAMNEIFDFGRPASITLACLVSLPRRELPIQADCLGAHLNLPANQRVKLSGPNPLELNLVISPATPR